MPDLADLLLRLADTPLSDPEPIAALERRVRTRRRWRRAGRAAGAVACALAVALPALPALTRGPAPPPMGLATSQTREPAPSAAAVQATPDDPSGRLLPTWLPGDLRIRTEQETAATVVGAATGWSRTYVRRGPLAGDQDSLALSLRTDAAPLDVGAEVGRYPGARLVTVQGRPAVFLAYAAARGEAGVSWIPAPGQRAQVSGSGVSEEELMTVAQGLRLPPQLDATPLPEGFTEVARRDGQPLSTLTPRTYVVGTSPARGPAPNPAFSFPTVRIAAAWSQSLPAGEGAGPVRGHEAVLSSDDAGAGLSWLERADLLVTVSGTNLEIDELRRIAEGLREQSKAEVMGRPTGERVVVAQGDLGGAPFELRVRGGISGPCLELVHGWVASTCASDPMRRVADLSASGSVSQGVYFGVVVPEARTVRIELAGGQTVDTEAVGQTAGQGAAFFVVALPPDVHRVEAVVALGPDGQVLRRTVRD